MSHLYEDLQRPKVCLTHYRISGKRPAEACEQSCASGRADLLTRHPADSHHRSLYPARCPLYAVPMPTPYESARLNLQLYELRREPILREARAWFLMEFNPESFEELMTVVRGDRNASFRMVLGYWDMAASLVTMGAIGGDAFRAAHGEIFGAFCKIHPLLEELRAAAGEPEFCRHIEAVVMADPDAAAILKRRRKGLSEAARASTEANRSKSAHHS